MCQAFKKVLTEYFDMGISHNLTFICTSCHHVINYCFLLMVTRMAIAFVSFSKSCKNLALCLVLHISPLTMVSVTIF